MLLSVYPHILPHKVALSQTFEMNKKSGAPLDYEQQKENITIITALNGHILFS